MLSDQMLIEKRGNRHTCNHAKQAGKTASEKIGTASHSLIILPFL